MTHISICHSFLVPQERGIIVYGCIVFSLELLFKRENIVSKKAMGVVKGCHSYLNLSLISGLPRKGIFSLLNEYRRETDKGDQKGRRVFVSTLPGIRMQGY